MYSNLLLMLEQIWDLYMEPLIIILMASLWGYCLKNHWDLLMVKCLDLMKTINCDHLMVDWYYT